MFGAITSLLQYASMARRSVKKFPDRLWGPPSLLSSGYWGILSPGDEADHLHLSPRLRMRGVIPPFPDTY
jgi:hypothetical protein